VSSADDTPLRISSGPVEDYGTPATAQCVHGGRDHVGVAGSVHPDDVGTEIVEHIAVKGAQSDPGQLDDAKRASGPLAAE
jgi:hypothetical protein